jgi:hypothetical protein
MRKRNNHEERRTEEQKVRQDLKKLKGTLHKVVEAGREMNDKEDRGAEMRRRRTQFMKRIPPILNLLKPEKIEE